MRASIILPTFGDAPFIRWAIASAQRQTVHELEICVICDGSPPQMVDTLRGLSREDPRIRVFSFPKGPRHGEIYRHQVITDEATGRIVCYLSHDDLYLPWHVESMERALEKADFANSVAVGMTTTRDEKGQLRAEVQAVVLTDLEDAFFRDIVLEWDRKRRGFGLIFGSHTRDAYLRLPEGWATTPSTFPTDMYMWRKFVAYAGQRCASPMEITALHFERSAESSPGEREASLAWWFSLTQRPDFGKTINQLALRRIARDVAHGASIGPRRVPAFRVPLDFWRVWWSGFFDAPWYLERNPDVLANGVNPLWHFVRWGALEGRSPGPGFDSTWYRATNPGIPADVNPLVYYLKKGKVQGHHPIARRSVISPRQDISETRDRNP